ncbi:uncharacterized protein LOC110822305 [Carica papaya]|uniref:uncharacterized protein LOC110822305 n=1 Tax=Carica papaya TaxID=3649 RepID=UPI000B8D10F3|nr:uncharacterized protein LOC110822305 [Carica papaya]
MALLRALSTRKPHGGYERLVDDPSVGLMEGKLQRTTSVPASRLFCRSTKLVPEIEILYEEKIVNPKLGNIKPAAVAKNNVNSNNNVKKASKAHPLFSLFDVRRSKKKTTAKQEFQRYLEYVKEGGLWDRNSSMPVMHYK